MVATSQEQLCSWRVVLTVGACRDASRLPAAERRTADAFMMDCSEPHAWCLPDDVWRLVAQQLVLLHPADKSTTGQHDLDCKRFSCVLRDVAALAQTCRAMSNAAIVAYAHLSSVAAAAGLLRCVPAHLADSSFLSVASEARSSSMADLTTALRILKMTTSGGRVLVWCALATCIIERIT